MNKLKCLVIDDEELARSLIENYINKVDYLECIYSFENPIEALSYIKNNDIDIIFLDIQMPEIKGTDFAELISKPGIKIIFTTAYSEYALKGFELNAMDYLVKPITFKRFIEAIEKYPKTNMIPDKHIVIKSGYDYYKADVNDIIFIKSESEYVNYHLENGKKIMANQSLSKLISQLPDCFLRVHRSYIINKEKVISLKKRDLTVNNHTISVGDSYYDKVKKELFKTNH